MLKRIGHHLLVRDIPVPANNEAEIKTFMDRSLNHIFVTQAIKNLLDGQVQQKVNTCSNNLNNP